MGGDDNRAAASALLEALRLWGGAFGELGRQFGIQAGMHVTDSEALIQIINAEDRDAPLTQAALSRRIGLSPGATSSLLNRLETAGHIERRRERADRRVVTLRSTPAVHRQVQEFFAAVGGELEDSAVPYPAEVLAQFATLMGAMTAIMERHLALRISRPDRD